MAYEQPRFPEDDESLPREIRGKHIGYVDHNAPEFVPNPLDVGTIRTDGLGGQEGYHLDRYSPLFHKGSQDAVIKPGYGTVPAVAHSLVDEELVSNEHNFGHPELDDNSEVSEERFQSSGESISNFAEELNPDNSEPINASVSDFSVEETPVSSEEVAEEDSDNATSE